MTEKDDRFMKAELKCPWCGLLSTEFLLRKYSSRLVKCVCGKYFTVSRRAGADIEVYKC